MTKIKDNIEKTEVKTVDIGILENALNTLLDAAQSRLGQAGAKRARLLTTDDPDGITITREWLEQYADVHTDIGGASAVVYVVETLRELVGLPSILHREGNENDGENTEQ